MHALGEFIREQMELQGLTQASLARQSGLSKQHVSHLLDDSKSRLRGMIEDKTITGLARAFRVPEEVIITKAAEALGIPLDRLTVVMISPAEMSDEVLLRELTARLARARRETSAAYESAKESVSGDAVGSEPSVRNDNPLGTREAGRGSAAPDPNGNAMENRDGATHNHDVRPNG